MVALARQARRDPGIRYLSAGLVFNVAPKDYRAEVDTIFQYVQSNIRYTQDINGVETIQYPENTLEFGYGDCDDMALLLASMLESIGHPTRFAAVGFEIQNQFEHVVVQTLIGTRWVTLDATEPNAMGWEPPDIITWLVRDI